jgi:hypothetical protein
MEWVFPFSNQFLGQKLPTAPFELEHCHGGESNHWAKVPVFVYAQLYVTASVFLHNKLGCLFGLVE